jgi:hypothetical protein
MLSILITVTQVAKILSKGLLWRGWYFNDSHNAVSGAKVGKNGQKQAYLRKYVENYMQCTGILSG